VRVSASFEISRRRRPPQTFVPTARKRPCCSALASCENDVMRRRVQLLLCFSDESRQLSGELQRSIRRAARCGGMDAHCLLPHGRWAAVRSQPPACHVPKSVLLVQAPIKTTGNSALILPLPPVDRTQTNLPGGNAMPHTFAGNLQLERHLKKLAHRFADVESTPLALAPLAASGRIPGCGISSFTPHVFQDVVLRLEAAAVAVDDQGSRSVSMKGLPSASTPVTTSGTACTIARAPPFAQPQYWYSSRSSETHVRGIRGNNRCQNRPWRN